MTIDNNLDNLLNAYGYTCTSTLYQIRYIKNIGSIRFKIDIQTMTLSICYEYNPENVGLSFNGDGEYDEIIGIKTYLKITEINNIPKLEIELIEQLLKESYKFFIDMNECCTATLKIIKEN